MLKQPSQPAGRQPFRGHFRGHFRGRGFTLLELMLAVVLAGIVATVLYASLAVSFQARDAAAEAVGLTANGRMALEVVRGDLAGVPRPRGILAGAFIGEDETGPDGRDDDRLSYFTNNPAMRPSDPAGELLAVELRLAEPANAERQLNGRRGRVLVRAVRTNPLATVEQRATVQVLARRVHGMNARFSDGTTWYDAWDSTQRGDALPAAIELTLHLLPEELDEDLTPTELEEELVTIRRVLTLLNGTNEAASQG